MQQLINYIEEIVRLSPEAVHALTDLSVIERYTKNEYILEPGQYCHKIWFILEGMVRKFYYNNGSEVTTWIHTENEIFTSLSSYARKAVADEYLQACEDTKVISITRSDSERLGRFPEIVTFTNVMMEREFVNIDKHTKALSQKDAKGKFEYIREIAPEIVKRAKLGHIASIIGVTPETLSRIRKG